MNQIISRSMFKSIFIVVSLVMVLANNSFANSSRIQDYYSLYLHYVDKSLQSGDEATFLNAVDAVNKDSGGSESRLNFTSNDMQNFEFYKYIMEQTNEYGVVDFDKIVKQARSGGNRFDQVMADFYTNIRSQNVNGLNSMDPEFLSTLMLSTSWQSSVLNSFDQNNEQKGRAAVQGALSFLMNRFDDPTTLQNLLSSNIFRGEISNSASLEKNGQLWMLYLTKLGQNINNSLLASKQQCQVAEFFMTNIIPTKENSFEVAIAVNSTTKEYIKSTLSQLSKFNLNKCASVSQKDFNQLLKLVASQPPKEVNSTPAVRPLPQVGQCSVQHILSYMSQQLKSDIPNFMSRYKKENRVSIHFLSATDATKSSCHIYSDLKITQIRNPNTKLISQVKLEGIIGLYDKIVTSGSQRFQIQGASLDQVTQAILAQYR